MREGWAGMRWSRNRVGLRAPRWTRAVCVKTMKQLKYRWMPGLRVETKTSGP